MKRLRLGPIAVLGALLLAQQWETAVASGASAGHSSPTKPRVVHFRRNPILAQLQPSCQSDSDCQFQNTFCNVKTGKCQCEPDYVQIASFVNKSYISHTSMTCVRLARLNERCVSDDQCIVEYSDCVKSSQPLPGSKRNIEAHYCKCAPGHSVLEDHSADVIIDGRTYRTRPLCSWERPVGVSWLSTLILLILLVIFILIVTFVALVRYQRWRNQPYPVTITSLTNNGGLGPGMGAMHPGHHPHLHGSASPPPMGSAEAEFENDFIQVFPMHHLEPMPDKNVHAYIIK